MKLRGQWWITDPVFSERASPVPFFGPKRFHAPPIALDALPPLRGVLLSHDHYDHLDRATVRALADRAEVFLTPLGVGDRLIDWGVDGLITDYPDRARAVMRDKGMALPAAIQGAKTPIK